MTDTNLEAYLEIKYNGELYNWLLKNIPQETPVPSDPQNILLLDLDRTLVEAAKAGQPPDYCHEEEYNLMIRPGALKFINAVHSYFQKVCIVSGGVKSYVSDVTKFINERLKADYGMDNAISEYYHRGQLKEIGYMKFRKDLTLLGFPTDRSVLIDDQITMVPEEHAMNVLHIPWECEFRHDGIDHWECLEILVKHLATVDDIPQQLRSFHEEWKVMGVSYVTSGCIIM